MSQAAINVRTRKITSARRIDGIQLTGLIFLIIVSSVIIWAGWMMMSWMQDPHRLPLSRMVVTGERYYTTSDNIRQAILALGSPGIFITQDVDVIRQQIERMPWIKRASVRKQWPDELKIHLVEYAPVSRWNDLYLLDDSGKVFSAPVDQSDNKTMPMLYGPEGSEKDVLAGYRTMNKVLTASKFHLKAVSMSARHSWQLTLQDDICLKLGRDDRVRRLQRFIGIYPVIFQQARDSNKRISYVDLRYDSGLAVGWMPAYVNPKNNNQQQAKQQ
ncbi:MAG: cell division protein FtsQ [Sodalis sp. Psp]|nr:cell division protein FtsQ [Sodalis sp. Psp]MCR3756721.1 cell division protein FtsQ [Sodalis sp. Ppy]